MPMIENALRGHPQSQFPAVSRSVSIKKNVICQQQVFVFKVQISVLEGRDTITPSNQ